MELPSKLLEQIAFNTKPKIEEHMLIVMDKSIHEEHLSQPIQSNNEQFKITITFLTGCNGIFIVSNSFNKLYFTKSINDGDFSVISVPHGAYELASLNDEIKRILIEDGYCTEENYPFIIKPSCSTLGSIIEVKQNFNGAQFIFTPNESIRDLLGFDSVVIYEKYILSRNPVDILSFGNFFLKCNIAQGMIFQGKRSEIIHKFTMDVDPGHNFFKKISGKTQRYMMESKDIISSTCFKLKNENNQLVSFNGQSINFRLSTKKF